LTSSYAYHREVENSWLVRERDRRRRREHLRVLLAALPVAAALVGYTWLHVQVLDTAYEIGQLESELRGLERQRAELALETAQHSSLPEIERRARDELGMVEPRAERTLFWPLSAAAPPAPVASPSAPSATEASP
jgi:cell division protein FtsB